jgi:anti-sigma factor RsiW
VTTNRTPDCEWVLERLDAFVDDELDAAGHAAVTAHCATCSACTRELEMAVRVRDTLRGMPAFETPARVVDAAERETRAGASNVVSWPARPGVRRLRTAAVLAAALIVIVAGARLLDRQLTAHERQVSEADVRRASAELALAFGYVSRYSDGVVREDVMEKRVMPHIERAISRDSARSRPKETGM